MLVEGRLRVRIWRQDGLVPPGFEPARATLEDAYLVLTHRGRVTREEALLSGAAR